MSKHADNLREKSEGGQEDGERERKNERKCETFYVVVLPIPKDTGIQPSDN